MNGRAQSASVWYRDELQARLRDDGVGITYVYTRAALANWPRPPGRIDATVVADASWPASVSPTFYVCGPTSFVEHSLTSRAPCHSPERIRTEGPDTLRSIDHDYSLRNELDSEWAAQPLALSHYNGQQVLVLRHPGGEPLDRLFHGPIEITRVLRIAIGLATALNHVHQRQLIHKDIKPSNILVAPRQ